MPCSLQNAQPQKARQQSGSIVSSHLEGESTRTRPTESLASLSSSTAPNVGAQRTKFLTLNSCITIPLLRTGPLVRGKEFARRFSTMSRGRVLHNHSCSIRSWHSQVSTLHTYMPSVASRTLYKLLCIKIGLSRDLTQRWQQESPQSTVTYYTRVLFSY